MARRTLLSFGFPILIAAAAWLEQRPPTGPCVDTAVNNSAFRAVEVIAQPWLGPHHVYGLFVVPDRYASRAFHESLRVRGYEEEFERIRFPRPAQVDDVLASPGYYVKRTYVPTRVAMWFLFTGRFGDLRTACNWTLVFTPRVPIATVPAN
jgi:hypothetical protein